MRPVLYPNATEQGARAPGIPLRRRLFLLAAAAILPLAVMSGLGLYALARQQRVQAQKVGQELARSVANAVDAELRSSIQVLETLATSQALDTDDVAGFRARAQRVLVRQPGWAAIRLASPGAEVLVDTRFGAGVPPPPLLDRESFHGGLGLGLALVKHLVELHGGEVVAQSEGEGRGATPPTVRLDGVRVIVADDEPDAARLAEAILAEAGAQVRSCSTAAEALEAVRRWRPDVLVSDIEMPDEDGYSLIRKVRSLASSDGGRTPAVALTAYGRPLDRKRALAAGYSMHVPKPVDPGELTAIVAGVAGRG